jgi:hypothetical protein
MVFKAVHTCFAYRHVEIDFVFATRGKNAFSLVKPVSQRLHTPSSSTNRTNSRDGDSFLSHAISS